MDAADEILIERLNDADTPQARAALLSVDLAPVARAAGLLFALSLSFEIVLIIAIMIFVFAASWPRDLSEIIPHLIIGTVGGLVGFLAYLAIAGLAFRLVGIWPRSLAVAAGSVLQILVFALVAMWGGRSPAVLGGLILVAVIAGTVSLVGPKSMMQGLSGRVKPKSLLQLHRSPGWMWAEHGKVGSLILLSVTSFFAIGAESVLVVVTPELTPIAIVLSAVAAVFVTRWRETPVRQFPVWIAYPVILAVAIPLAT